MCIRDRYDRIGEQWRRQMTFRRYIYVDLGWRHEYCGLFSLESRGVTWYFVDNEKYFRRGRLYGEFDDGERFAFFSKAVVDLLPSLDWMPDILHCNDWQTALVPIYLKDVATRWPEVRGIRTVFTIHNIEYQGRYGADSVDQLFGLDRGWYDDGTLRMDGVDVRDASLHDVRKNIAFVSQHPVLFHGTIMEHIRLGRQDATDEEVMAAARAAAADGFIMGMPDGYQTMLGDGGSGLSGGQRQRVAIARAFLKDAPVLILDEATASLDAESEAQIQQELDRLVEGRTALIVAHRFSSIRVATRILVFEGGRIIGDGTHAELYASCPLYRELYDRQSL